MLVGAREALTVEGLKFSESVAPRRGLVGGAEAMNENRAPLGGKRTGRSRRAEQGKPSKFPFLKLNSLYSALTAGESDRVSVWWTAIFKVCGQRRLEPSAMLPPGCGPRYASAWRGSASSPVSWAATSLDM